MADDDRDPWRALVRLVAPWRGRFAVLGALLAVAAALALSGPLLVRAVLDGAVAGAPAGRIVALAAAFLAVAVGAQAMQVVVAWMATRTAWTITNDLRLRATAHLLGLDHGFHRSHTPGELIERIDGDVTAVSDFLARVVAKVVGGALLVLGMLAVLTVIDPRIGLAMGAVVAAAVALIAARRTGATAEHAREQGMKAHVFGGIEERLRAAEDLRANGGGPWATWRLVEDSRGLYAAAQDRVRAGMRVWWVAHAAVASGTVVALSVGAALVHTGAVTVGTAFLVLQYGQLLRRPLEELTEQLTLVQQATGGMSRVVALFAVRSAVVDAGTASLPPGPLAVELRDVGVDYGDGVAVLHGVSLRLEPGRTLGLVGRTGSGKTTLARLVARLLDTTEGVVALGGVDVRDVALAELRRRVAFVPQDVQLLEGTIRDNVTVFDDAVPDDAVAVALRRVGLDRLVDGPDGVHRLLGPGGAGLSAGEAQLLALSRVWLRGADVVVLDEATARVDPTTEARLDAAVDELLAGRTAIVIAHRLGTLARVDDIAVIDAGRVAETGPRAALAAAGAGAYRRLLDLAQEPGDDAPAGVRR